MHFAPSKDSRLLLQAAELTAYLLPPRLYHGLRCIDRIVVLSAPISSHDAGSALGAADMIAERVRSRTSTADTLDPPPLRRAHHDLALFGRQPAPTPDAEAADGTETSDA